MNPISMAGRLQTLAGSDAPMSLDEQVTRLYEDARDDLYRYLLILGFLINRQRLLQIAKRDGVVTHLIRLVRQ